MTYKDSIKWLEALKREIGQVQHRDLWHFEGAIDETIANLRPLAESHGRLIDVDKLFKAFNKAYQTNGYWTNFFALVDEAPTVIEAEASE